MMVSSRPVSRRGLTLMELVVTMALLSIFMVIGLRLVFVTDRALNRETEAAETAATALSVSAILRDDTQPAESYTIGRSGSVLKLTMSDGTTVTYSDLQAGATRTSGSETRQFEGVRVHFREGDKKLVEATISDARQKQLEFAVRPRNMQPDRPQDDEVPPGAPPAMGGDE